MEARDISIIMQNKNHYQLNKLYQDHLEFEKHISTLASAKGLGTKDASHLQNLKKMKLEGRESIEQILTTLR